MTKRTGKTTESTTSAVTGRYVKKATARKVSGATKHVHTGVKVPKVSVPKAKVPKAKVPKIKVGISTGARDVTGLDQLDPATTEARDATHLRRIIAAAKGLEEAEADLRDAVAAARADGESWTVIGAALGVSRQGAYQRFGR